MPSQDRTQEFNAIAESIRTKQAHKAPWKSKQQQKSQFMLTAARIGKDIFEASDKLNKLTKLAKKNSLFDNPTVEIEELTFIIKQDIQNLNHQITTLKEFAKSNNSSSTQGEAHSKTVINYLNYKLADTTKGFKDILEVRTENLKTQQERRRRFTGATTAPVTPPSTHHNHHHHTTTRLLADHPANTLPDSPSASGGEVAISMPGGGMLLQQEHTSTRAAAVENIEKTLVELQGIFGDLLTLVAQQGDMIQRLDANVENTALYVDRGHGELLKHLYNISSNRGLIIKLFIVLIVFAVLFVVFVV